MQRLREQLTYANVVATLALVGVIAGGGAYAAGLIGSGDVRDNSLRSVDLKNGKGVSGRDVKTNSIKGPDVREASLNASKFVPIAGATDANCNPMSTARVPCATTSVSLPQHGRILVVATGQFYSEGGPATLNCGIGLDGVDPVTDVLVGEASTDNTSLGATDGFAVTRVTGKLSKGRHDVSLDCAEPGPNDGHIAVATIAVLGVGG